MDFGATWQLLPLLLLLLIAVLANLALAVAMLPTLVRMLTGYESTFSRSGLYFVQSPLFFLFVVLLGWLAFDPFVQAVYCVRCFHAESRETGEDIRVGLRLVRSAVVLLAAVCCARAADAVSPADLQQSVQRTMQAPDYAWRIPPPGAVAAGQMWDCLRHRQGNHGAQEQPEGAGQAHHESAVIGSSTGWVCSPTRKAGRSPGRACTGACMR